MDLIKIAEEAFATKKELPSFKSGDTITVAYRIKEGNKERIQQYRGVVIRISGHGDKKRFTVRKMSENVEFSRSNLRLSKASRLTKSVKYVVLNCTTCVPLPVRKQESKKRECNLSDSIAIRKAIQRNAGWLFVYRFLQCPS
jgi:ribosomal protein L19